MNNGGSDFDTIPEIDGIKFEEGWLCRAGQRLAVEGISVGLEKVQSFMFSAIQLTGTSASGLKTL